jgi:hypothetical protein
MDDNSLDDILSEEPVITVETLEGPTEGLTGDGEPPRLDRGPDGKFVAKQSTGVEETVPPTDKLPQEEYVALRASREENKAIKADMEALKAQLQSLQQPKEPPVIPSIWDDEQAALDHYGNQAVEQAVQRATMQSQLAMSEMLSSQAHDDFDEVKAKFLEMAQGNPALAEQALATKHPWEKAYQIAKNAATMAELGATNLDELKAKMREELMAEMQGQAPRRPGLPPTLTTERNVGNRSGPAWAGPMSLDDMLRQ